MTIATLGNKLLNEIMDADNADVDTLRNVQTNCISICLRYANEKYVPSFEYAKLEQQWEHHNYFEYEGKKYHQGQNHVEAVKKLSEIREAAIKKALK